MLETLFQFQRYTTKVSLLTFLTKCLSYEVRLFSNKHAHPSCPSAKHLGPGPAIVVGDHFVVPASVVVDYPYATPASPNPSVPSTLDALNVVCVAAAAA